MLPCRARYGVQLEKGSFEKRTADFLWMMIFGATSLLVSGTPTCYVLQTNESILLRVKFISILIGSGTVCYSLSRDLFVGYSYG